MKIWAATACLLAENWQEQKLNAEYPWENPEPHGAFKDTGASGEKWLLVSLQNDFIRFCSLNEYYSDRKFIYLQQ